MTDPKDRRPVVAVIDDDANLRRTVTALLHDSGFEAVPLADGAAFHARGPKPGVDLALIDLRLANENGLELAQALRRRHGLPIVMLTGRGDETDRIEGLETGADDYMMKPFNPRELIARIRAVLRRAGHPGMVSPDRDDAHQIAFGGLRLDLERRDLVAANGTEIALTNAEYRILQYLVLNPGRVIPRPELMAELGADLNHYGDRTIDVLILRLRRKIEPVPSKPVHLQTRRGQGYIFLTGSSP
ncbi:winged helix family two component transcriptional regulator [Aliiruegeria haliotis]|uniref:Winged helix family two component transcriptional regulator n=1 Tax=Aliiruegeria haliotis TaxID=1280846 RepID=A0A2T0RI84_9RHOB|nr:response regulator transcription factor [Aliiruegeria haliotis]PRY20859.1 winged helix family two component transcriptional regulator [Aliiruegeria haliotis]